MKILGLAGWSGSGKTTLLVGLLPELTARGLTVSTVKHAHHRFDVDTPGKDSYRHRDAGAHEVLVSSSERWALMREHRGGAEPTLGELVQHLAPVDLVLVEGFKNDTHAKIEVHRQALGQSLLCRDDANIVALAADCRPDGIAIPVFGLDDLAAIADFVVGFVRRGAAA